MNDFAEKSLPLLTKLSKQCKIALKNEYAPLRGNAGEEAGATAIAVIGENLRQSECPFWRVIISVSLLGKRKSGLLTG